jgi:hypothetical protein
MHLHSYLKLIVMHKINKMHDTVQYLNIAFDFFIKSTILITAIWKSTLFNMQENVKYR